MLTSMVKSVTFTKIFVLIVVCVVIKLDDI